MALSLQELVGLLCFCLKLLKESIVIELWWWSSVLHCAVLYFCPINSTSQLYSWFLKKKINPTLCLWTQRSWKVETRGICLKTVML